MEGYKGKRAVNNRCVKGDEFMEGEKKEIMNTKEMSIKERLIEAETIATKFASLDADNQMIIGGYISGYLAGIEAQKAKQQANL